MSVSRDPTSLFYKSMLFVLVLRIGLAAWFPMTADEAYFITWGKYPDYGFYDHTPILGWLLSSFLWLSDAGWWLRMPAVLLPIFLAWGIYKILLPRYADVAPWVAMAFLFAPINIINVLITHDIPLIYLSFISAWFFYKAVHVTQSKMDYLWCGLFLGLAFFSKYFAVLLGVAYGFYIVVIMRDKKSWRGLLIIFSGVLPFLFLNLLWNYNNCWNNILFNLFNRTAAADDIATSMSIYITTLVYLISPPLIYYIFKNRKSLVSLWQNKLSQSYMWIALFPLFLFFLLVFHKEIGLHWVLSFFPFVFVAFASLLSTTQWRRTLIFMAAFSLLHIMILSTIMMLPETTFASKKEAVQNLTFAKYPDELLAKLAPYEENYKLASISYGFGSLLYYHSRKHVMIIGAASFHARQDDNITDYRELDGKNILIIKRTGTNLDVFKRYFNTSQRKTIYVRDASFELLLGDGFNYNLYHKEVLERINRDYYAKPAWLPVGQCRFQSIYGLK